MKARSSVEEHYLDVVGVSGSKPLVPTEKAILIKLVFIWAMKRQIRPFLKLRMNCLGPAHTNTNSTMDGS
jgi:hypothetical protein